MWRSLPQPAPLASAALLQMPLHVQLHNSKRLHYNLHCRILWFTWTCSTSESETWRASNNNSVRNTAVGVSHCFFSTFNMVNSEFSCHWQQRGHSNANGAKRCLTRSSRWICSPNLFQLPGSSARICDIQQGKFQAGAAPSSATVEQKAVQRFAPQNSHAANAAMLGQNPVRWHSKPQLAWPRETWNFVGFALGRRWKADDNNLMGYGYSQSNSKGHAEHLTTSCCSHSTEIHRDMNFTTWSRICRVWRMSLSQWLRLMRWIWN